MNGLDMGDNTEPTMASEMKGEQLYWHFLCSWLIRFRRRFVPMLVWWGDEVDVRITFKSADRGKSF